MNATEIFFLGFVVFACLVVATILALVFFFMLQSRDSDRLTYRELHEFMLENREAILKLQEWHRRSEGDAPSVLPARPPSSLSLPARRDGPDDPVFEGEVRRS